MNIRAALIDFDETVVRTDLLSLACEFAGKKQESIRLNEEYMKNPVLGLGPLITRINYLKGQKIEEIIEFLDQKDLMMPGASEFFSFLKENRIISIITSGNLVSILEHFQKRLEADHIVGSRPKIEDGMIAGIEKSDYSCDDFKLSDCLDILDNKGISAPEVIAIGDSPADRSIFEFAAKSIAINPRDGIEKYADFIIRDDLSKAIPIIMGLMKVD
jgi:HAD superfamily phosphoserine phosphatase-like hydrolase